MDLRYDIPPSSGTLRQGEILRDVYEHVPNFPAAKSKEGEEFPVNSIHHPLLIVMSPDCDLVWDFKGRFPDKQGKEQPKSIQDFLEIGKIVLHVILAKITKDITKTLPPSILRVLFAKICDTGTIYRRCLDSSHFDRVSNNQDERYHHFPEAPVGNPPIYSVPELYIDFKKSLSIPTQNLYEGLQVGGIKRVALIPDKYIHDLMHRSYGFLSRVAV